jgi:hypothetical protein
MGNWQRRTRLGAWGAICLLVSMLVGCLGGGGGLVQVTPTPVCPGTPPTVVAGEVKTADHAAATITADATSVAIVQYSASTRFMQLNLADANALLAGERAQILVTPASGTTIAAARAIVMQNGAPVADAPAQCSTAAQAGDPEIQGTITSVNHTSQSLTLVDDRNVQYILTFSASTIIGQPETAQLSDVAQGDLLLASGTAIQSGISASTVIILATTIA